MVSRCVDGARALRAPPGTTLIAIGNFDGVHRGHRIVLSDAVSTARDRGLDPVVLTFHPHPAEVLGKGKLLVLTPLERKVDLLCRFSPDLRIVVQPFTRELAASTPEAFAEDLLREQLGARVVLVGENFRFGRGRAGDLARLEALGHDLGFEARAVSLRGDDGGAFSSSRIRRAIAEGDLETAERLLGRPHALTGIVTRGDQRGRTIGVPTANLTDVVEVLPPNGVYACLVDRLDAEGAATRLGSGVANIGERPTVKAGFSVEAHLFDFDADLYDARLRLHLVARLREERSFSGLDALKAQIQRDIHDAKRLTADRAPDPDAGDAWY